VEPLADLEGPEQRGSRQSWNDQAPDELAGLAVLIAVADEELLERQRAYRIALAQFDMAAERDEQRRQIPDRRRIGDASADGACGAHLDRTKPPQDFRDVRIDRGQRRRRARQRDRRTDM